MGCDIHARYYLRTNGELREFQLAEVNEPGRSYPLFAALAGVRNSFNVVPIAPPQGFPAELEHAAPPHDDVFHGASFLTLAEMLAYDWLGGAWQQERFRLALHEYTAPFRNITLPALARRGDPSRVLMVFCFDN